MVWLYGPAEGGRSVVAGEQCCCDDTREGERADWLHANPGDCEAICCDAVQAMAEDGGDPGPWGLTD